MLGIAPLSLPRVEWLGLFPSLQSVLAQLAVLLAFFTIAATRLYSHRWRASPSTSSG